MRSRGMSNASMRYSIFSSVPTVTKTSAPTTRQICIAAMPMPPQAEWIRTVCQSCFSTTLVEMQSKDGSTGKTSSLDIAYLSCFQICQMKQPIDDGSEDAWHRGRLFEAEAVWDLDTHVRWGLQNSRIGAGGDDGNPISYLEVHDVGPQPCDDSGAFDPEAASAAFVPIDDAHGDQHILICDISVQISENYKHQSQKKAQGFPINRMDLP